MSKIFLTSSLIVLFALLSAMSSACSTELLADEPLDPRPRRNAEEVGAAIERWRLRHDVPGLAVVVFNADNQQLWLKGRRNGTGYCGYGFPGGPACQPADGDDTADLGG